MLVSVFVFSTLLGLAASHGELKSPRSRNWLAHNVGTDSGVVEGTPPAEYCYHCLNTNPTSLGDKGVCGVSTNHDYNQWLDSAGLPMPWSSQATYNQGDTIVLETYLDAHHAGHMMASLCPVPDDPTFAPTQGCFDTNPLMFVEDLEYGMPKDGNYPTRGYYAGGQGSSTHRAHRMKFKLPNNVLGPKVLLQWRYITANSCSPPGYAAYFQNNSLPSNWWSPAVPPCTPPYPHDGSRNSGWPEQFWNCAEITIVDPLSTGSLAPTGAPSTSSPNTPSPTMSSTPGSSGPCCSEDYKTCNAGWVHDQYSCETFGYAWLEGGALTSGCTARYQDCSASACCPGLTCTPNQDSSWFECGVASTQGTPNPTTEPTPQPSPQPSPQTQGTPSPTQSPTSPATSAVSTGPCCSQDYKTCITWCGDTQSSCANCDPSVGAVWLSNGAQSGCLERWADCTSDQNGCCGGLTCRQQTLWWWQCLP